MRSKPSLSGVDNKLLRFINNGDTTVFYEGFVPTFVQASSEDSETLPEELGCDLEDGVKVMVKITTTNRKIIKSNIELMNSDPEIQFRNRFGLRIKSNKPLFQQKQLSAPLFFAPSSATTGHRSHLPCSPESLLGSRSSNDAEVELFAVQDDEQYNSPIVFNLWLWSVMELKVVWAVWPNIVFFII
ncbi:hypothetical protein V2J09_009081 [Rumex salicifolius]